MNERDKTISMICVGGPNHGEVKASPNYYMNVAVFEHPPRTALGKFYEPIIRKTTYQAEHLDLVYGQLRISGWYWRWEGTPHERAASMALLTMLSAPFELNDPFRGQ